MRGWAPRVREGRCTPAPAPRHPAPPTPPTPSHPSALEVSTTKCQFPSAASGDPAGRIRAVLSLYRPSESRNASPSADVSSWGARERRWVGGGDKGTGPPARCRVHAWPPPLWPTRRPHCVRALTTVRTLPWAGWPAWGSMACTPGAWKGSAGDGAALVVRAPCENAYECTSPPWSAGSARSHRAAVKGPLEPGRGIRVVWLVQAEGGRRTARWRGKPRPRPFQRPCRAPHPAQPVP